MRILFFADNFKPETNAPATHIYERCRYWAAWGHQVTVVTGAPNFPEGRVYPGYKNRLRSVETDRRHPRHSRLDVHHGQRRNAPPHARLRVVRAERRAQYAWAKSCPMLSSAARRSSSPTLAGVIYSKLRGVPHVFELRDIWPASIAAVSGLQPGRMIRLLEKLELWLYEQQPADSFVHRVVQARPDAPRRRAGEDRHGDQRREPRSLRAAAAARCGAGAEAEPARPLRRRLSRDMGLGAWPGERDRNGAAPARSAGDVSVRRRRGRARACSRNSSPSTA